MLQAYICHGMQGTSIDQRELGVVNINALLSDSNKQEEAPVSDY